MVKTAWGVNVEEEIREGSEIKAGKRGKKKCRR